MIRIALALLILLASCGYRIDGKDAITVSVPYVKNDFEGELTDALVRALSRTANFRYEPSGGDWTLQVNICSQTNDRIGYRYDRDPTTGELRTNILGTENRKEITAEVCVVKTSTGELILGPQKIKASADYDYDDPNSLVDLSFINPETSRRTTSIQFSLGQLDSVGTAGEDAIYPIYRLLAQQIVDGMIASGGPEDFQ